MTEKIGTGIEIVNKLNEIYMYHITLPVCCATWILVRDQFKIFKKEFEVFTWFSTYNLKSSPRQEYCNMEISTLLVSCHKG